MRRYWSVRPEPPLSITCDPLDGRSKLYGSERIVRGTDGSEFGVDGARKAPADAWIDEKADEQILHRNAVTMLSHVVTTARRKRFAA
jgi:hypothetical protein